MEVSSPTHHALGLFKFARKWLAFLLCVPEVCGSNVSWENTDPIPLVAYVNILRSKLISIIFKYSVRNSKEIQHVSITKISWLTP
jgi:hypothetical protein